MERIEQSGPTYNNLSASGTAAILRSTTPSSSHANSHVLLPTVHVIPTRLAASKMGTLRYRIGFAQASFFATATGNYPAVRRQTFAASLAVIRPNLIPGSPKARSRLIKSRQGNLA